MSKDKRYLYLTRSERSYMEVYFENYPTLPTNLEIQISNPELAEELISFWSEFTLSLITKFDGLQNGGDPYLGKPVFLDHLQQEAEILIRCKIRDNEIAGEAVSLMNSYIQHVFQIAERSRISPPSDSVESFHEGAPDLELQYEQITLSGMMLDNFVVSLENHGNSLFRILSKAAKELKSELGENAEITQNNLLGRAFAEIKSVDQRIEVMAEIPELFKEATSIEGCEVHPEYSQHYWNLFTNNISNRTPLAQFLAANKIIEEDLFGIEFCAQVVLEVKRLGKEISKEVDDGFWLEKLNDYGEPKNCGDNTADVAKIARQYIETCFLHALRGDDISQLYGTSWADKEVDRGKNLPPSRGS